MKAFLGCLILGLAIFGQCKAVAMNFGGFLTDNGLMKASGAANGFKTAKYMQYT